MIQIAIGVGAIILFGWLVQTLINIAKKDGASQREIDQSREAQRKLHEATKADIDSRKRNESDGGLLEDDGHRRD